MILEIKFLYVTLKKLKLNQFKMKITLGVKDIKGTIINKEVRIAYLVKFVNPNKMYPVSYTIKQDGTKVIGLSELKGEDLSENQIAELFSLELL